ncbi:MAG: hypothetical protein LBE83_10830 [Propionibacteriaceae bacterium]|nr:hypothetical protein [Propionibacteriaceae bacterium]
MIGHLVMTVLVKTGRRVTTGRRAGIDRSMTVHVVIVRNTIGRVVIVRSMTGHAMIVHRVVIGHSLTGREMIVVQVRIGIVLTVVLVPTVDIVLTVVLVPTVGIVRIVVLVRTVGIVGGVATVVLVPMAIVRNVVSGLPVPTVVTVQTGARSRAGEDTRIGIALTSGAHAEMTSKNAQFDLAWRPGWMSRPLP